MNHLEINKCAQLDSGPSWRKGACWLSATTTGSREASRADRWRREELPKPDHDPPKLRTNPDKCGKHTQHADLEAGSRAHLSVEVRGVILESEHQLFVNCFFKKVCVYTEKGKSINLTDAPALRDWTMSISSTLTTLWSIKSAFK